MQPVRIILWSVAVLVVGFVVFVAANVVTKTGLGSTLVNYLTGNFRDETAQTRFMSYATKITPLSRLEVAKLEQVEVFDRMSEETLFWKNFGLPQVVVRATVPVEYRYYVELGNAWTVVLENDVMTVTAPLLQPGTPSPNISELHFEVRKGSLLRSENAVAKALRQELTELLKQRAVDSQNLVKETARQQIAEIAKKWLNSESKTAQVVVRFADENPAIPNR